MALLLDFEAFVVYILEKETLAMMGENGLVALRMPNEIRHRLYASR